MSILTPRLILRNWTPADHDPMSAISGDPLVMRHFPAVLTRQETAAFIRRASDLYHKKGYTYFATEHRETGDMIGFIGLSDQTYKSPFTPATDIGWRLSTKYWGRGLATEGARACLEYAFAKANLKEVISVAVADNLPSIRVMEKIGLERWGAFDHPALLKYETLKRCVVYGVRKPVSL